MRRVVYSGFVAVGDNLNGVVGAGHSGGRGRECIGARIRYRSCQGVCQLFCSDELENPANGRENPHAMVVPGPRAPPLPERSCNVTVPEVEGVQFSVTGLPAEMEP